MSWQLIATCIRRIRLLASLAAVRSAPPPFPRFFLKESIAAAISDFMSPTRPLLSDAASMTSKLRRERVRCALSRAGTVNTPAFEHLGQETGWMTEPHAGQLGSA